jgi:phosphogluconate dehydratase
MHTVIENVATEIEKRSQNSRSIYLDLLSRSKESSPNREAISCSNLAHTYAACGKQSKEQVKKPMVGIISAYNDMLSAHAPFADYPEILKKEAETLDLHVQVAAGVPAMCDGITQGEPGMELSLFSRDTIALSTAIGLSHNVFDGALCMGTCDKIVPGLLIGSLRFGHLPTIFVPGGPMHSGISNADKAEKRKEFSAGKIDRIDLLAVEQSAYHSQGTCTFYGTANTNQLIAEAMGFQLSGAAFTPSNSPLREELTKHSIAALKNLIEQKLGLGEMLDVKNWVNGIVALLASGGSTNLVIHMIAMAKAGGFIITTEDFAKLSKITPLICSVYPNGSADVNQFHQAGGIAKMLQELVAADIIFQDIETVMGKGIDPYMQAPIIENEKLIWSKQSPTAPNPSIITSCSSPFKDNGGIKFIKGDIAEGIIKVSALKDENEVITAKARVFTDQLDVVKSFNGNEFKEDTIIVLIGQSPKHNGMPELHKLSSPIGVLRDQGLNIVLLTDGRMSGASGSFPAMIHAVSHNNNLYRIENGDLLTLDLKNESLSIDADLETFQARTPKIIKQSNIGLGRELFNLFRENISSPNTGATIFHDDI